MSTTIAIVIDNVDPSKMHRIKVKFTTDTLGGRNSHSSWCRMLTPMAGMNRGLTMLPEVGTEVLVGFAYRSATPYILGAVYNGVDLPEPYRNDDCLNNVRVFWSRNDHMVVFDDTEGFESVGLGAQAPDRLDVTSAGLHGVLSSSERVITHCSDGDTIVEAGQTISIRCANFRLESDATIDIEAGNATTAAAGSSAVIDGGSEAAFTAAAVKLNPSSPAAVPAPSKPVPRHNHPPIFGAGLGLNALSGLPEGGQGVDGEAAAPADPAGAETPGSGDGDAWDTLRDKTKATVGSQVDETVSDRVGGRMGDVLGDAAADLAEKGVDAAFDAVEGAIRDAFTNRGPGASGDGTRGRDDPRGTGSAATPLGEASDIRGPAAGPAKPTKPPADVDPSLPGGPDPTADADSAPATLDAERAPTDAPDPGRPSSLPSITDAAGSGESAPTLGPPEPALETAEASVDASSVAGEFPETDGPEPPAGADVGSGAAGASEFESGSTDSLGAPSPDGEPSTAAADSEAGTADSSGPATTEPEPRPADGVVRVEPGMDDSVAAPSVRPTVPDRPGVDATPEPHPDGDRGVGGEPAGPSPGSDAGARGPGGPRTSGRPSIDIGDIIDDLTPDET